VWALRAQNGPSLSLDEQLHWPAQLESILAVQFLHYADSGMDDYSRRHGELSVLIGQ